LASISSTGGSARPRPPTTARDVAASIGDCDHAVLIGLELGERGYHRPTQTTTDQNPPGATDLSANTNRRLSRHGAIFGANVYPPRRPRLWQPVPIRVESQATSVSYGWGPMKVTGHRGASAIAPKNTMAAFRLAIELGADGLEFDVQRTSDGELVVMHDAMIDRTTNGTGPVFDTPFEQLTGPDAGGWFDERFAGEPIPRLADVLQLDDVAFELELKDYGTELLFAVLAAVDDAGVLDRVKFTGWNLPLLAILKAERADVAHVYAGGITPRIVDRLHELGLQVHANDAVSRAEMFAARSAGVDSLSANDVEAAVAVRDDETARTTVPRGYREGSSR